MCAIVDASVMGEVFGPKPAPAGKAFFEWINSGNGRLVAGGKLLLELNQSGKFSQWASQALLSGRMRRTNDNKIDATTCELASRKTYKSNDPHVIALAQVSCARLLFSNDKSLSEDFRNKEFLDSPTGYVFSTLRTKEFTACHQKLIDQAERYCQYNQ